MKLTPEQQLSSAAQLFQEGKLNQARKIVESIDTESPIETARGLEILADIALAQGDRFVATQGYKQALKHQPDNADCKSKLKNIGKAVATPKPAAPVVKEADGQKPKTVKAPPKPTRPIPTAPIRAVSTTQKSIPASSYAPQVDEETKISDTGGFLGFVGAALLMWGVFSPVVNIGGRSINYLDYFGSNSWILGALPLLAGVCFWCSITKDPSVLGFGAVGSSGIVGWSYLKLTSLINQVTATGKTPSEADQIVSSVVGNLISLGSGWTFLISGCGLLLVATFCRETD